MSYESGREHRIADRPDDAEDPEIITPEDICIVCRLPFGQLLMDKDPYGRVVNHTLKHRIETVEGPCHMACVAKVNIS